MLADPRKAYLLLHAEAEFDCANPVAARAALEKAEFVVALTPFRHGTQYADALLPVVAVHRDRRHLRQLRGPRPVVPGRGEAARRHASGVEGAARARHAARPGRVSHTNRSTRSGRRCCPPPPTSRRGWPTGPPWRSWRPPAAAAGLERVADVPIHFADPLVRRAPSLQQTADAQPPRARMNAVTLARPRRRRRRAGARAAGRAARRCSPRSPMPAVPAGVVRIAAAHPSTCGLEGLSGPIAVERA